MGGNVATAAAFQYEKRLITSLHFDSFLKIRFWRFDVTIRKTDFIRNTHHPIRQTDTRIKILTCFDSSSTFWFVSTHCILIREYSLHFDSWVIVGACGWRRIKDEKDETACTPIIFVIDDVDDIKNKSIIETKKSLGCLPCLFLRLTRMDPTLHS